MALKVGQEFKRTSPNPIDEDLVLSKAQMLAVNDDLMPEKYFCVCKEDGRMYVYDKSATPNSFTGKFRIPGVVELTQAEYDALSTEEKNNGTTYFVTDGEGGSGGSGGRSVGGLKVAEAGVVRVPLVFEAGGKKDVTVSYSNSYGLLRFDPWGFSATILDGNDYGQAWENARDGIRLLMSKMIGMNGSNGFTATVYSEKAYNQSSRYMQLAYQYFAEFRRVDIAATDFGVNSVQDPSTGLWSTARMEFDGTYGYTITLASEIANAFVHGGVFTLLVDDWVEPAPGQYSIYGVRDETRPVVRNQNDGATYYPVTWLPINEGGYVPPKTTYLATHPNDLYSIYFTSYTTDNAYKYVPEQVDSIKGSLFSANASRKEWL